MTADPARDPTEPTGAAALRSRRRKTLRRLTQVVSDGPIEKVLYQVLPPDRHAAEVHAWVSQQVG
jgi:hypothetical protein